jgi:hypothetical protein
MTDAVPQRAPYLHLQVPPALHASLQKEAADLGTNIATLVRFKLAYGGPLTISMPTNKGISPNV